MIEHDTTSIETKNSNKQTIPHFLEGDDVPINEIETHQRIENSLLQHKHPKSETETHQCRNQDHGIRCTEIR